MTQYLAETLSAIPSHHPAIETLAEYSAGQMRPGFDLVVAAHLRGCARCRDEVAKFEAVGGGLLDEIEPASLDHGALAAAMARLEDAEQAPARTPARSLEDLLASAMRRWLAPGIWIAPLDTPHDRNDRVFLLRMDAGSVPKHRHSGGEIAQVLSGVLDSDGVRYRAGDMMDADESDVHAPKVGSDEPCICLFAIQGQLRATNLLGQLAFTWAGL